MINTKRGREALERSMMQPSATSLLSKASTNLLTKLMRASKLGQSFKLGNFLRKGLSNEPPRVDNQDCATPSNCSFFPKSMESGEQPDDDMMDFESGIDTWIIDKDDSNSSFLSEKTGREFSGEKNMNKENIKHTASTSSSKSLRNFRIRKRISYLEISSESENESSKKIDDRNHVTCNKRKSDPSKFSKGFTSFNTSNDKKREIDSLTSEEISSMLSEVDNNEDCSPGSNREKLHSIENVTSTIESKSTSPSQCNFKQAQCKFCKCNKPECCNCSPGKAKKIKYQHLNRKPSIKNVSPSQELTDMSSIPQEMCLVDNCSRCSKPLKCCNCNLIEVEPLNKIQENNHKQLITKNYVNSHGILPGGVNVKIVSGEKLTTLELGGNQSLVCGICGYLSAELLIHKSHQILFHSENSELECEYCDFKTTQCATLATHIRVHFQMNCHYCDYHCSLKSSYINHLYLNHQKEIRNHSYSCKICKYSCNLESKFVNHLQMHTLKKYQCGDCKKLFSNKSNLKKHIKKHLTAKNVFKCCKCDLRFSQKRSLKLHMKCHQKSMTSYVCSTCKLSFKRKCDLISHSKTHIDIPKSFKCEKCESSFSHGNHLKLHMRSHSVKYIKCKYCTFQCSSSSEIKNHLCVPVNKLYNVEKRSLNFESVGNDFKGNITRAEITAKKEVTCSSRTDPTQSLRTPVESKIRKSDDLNKRKKNRPKVLAVRKNLRPRKPDKKSEKNVPKVPQDRDIKRQGRAKKTKEERLQQHKKNGSFKNNKCHDTTIMQGGKYTKRQRKVVKRIKNYLVSKGLEIANQLFRKKNTLKDILIEPIAFINNRFIECYYQSQQPSSTVSLHQHEERHLRRPSLLSCRYCNYKTNSQQLLKCHIAKNHKWDPAVVSKLFKP